MQIRIRRIKSQDFERLIELFHEFAEFEKLPENMINTVDKMNAEKAYLHGFVALNTLNEIVGYVTFFYGYYTWFGKSLYMDDLYIQPEFRGKGIGTKLLNKVIAHARKSKCHKLRWQVSQWNKQAIAFYQSYGCTIDAIEQNCDLILN